MKSNLKDQILSLILQVALLLGLSFLSAVLLKDCWNWFLVPVAPVSTLGYGHAYGLILLFDAVAAICAHVRDDDEEAEKQEASPFLRPIVKALTKAVVFLLFWGVAAIAHCAIG